MILHVLIVIVFISIISVSNVYPTTYKNNNLAIEFEYPEKWNIIKNTSSYIQINNKNNLSFVGIEITPISKINNNTLIGLSQNYALNLSNEKDILKFEHINSTYGLGQQESYMLISSKDDDKITLEIWTILNEKMYFMGYFSENKNQLISDIKDLTMIIQSFKFL